MLNKTPTREEKIEQNEPHQKCFYKKVVVTNTPEE